MSNLKTMKTKDSDQNPDIMESVPILALFCICCLDREVPLLSLLTCAHADYLKNFIMPQINPRNQVICYQCHEKLKKIRLFKMQVEESFKMISDVHTENIPKSNNRKRRNLEIYEVCNIEIPQTNVADIEIPQTNVADIEIPQTNVADIEIPQINVADIEIPLTNVADIEIPQTNVADIEIPQTNVADIEIPQTNVADLEIPQINVADIEIPQTNVDDIENPETILEAASTITDDVINEENEVFVDTEKSSTPNSLQNKSMKNIQEALRIINNNQNSDCISFLANSLQSISHSIISDIYTNFDLESQIDTDPPEVIINGNTDPSDNIDMENSSDINDLLNDIMNSVENSEIMNENIDAMIENLAVENLGNEELKQSVTEEEAIDVFDCSTTLADEIPLENLGKRPSLGSNIKQLTLTRQQLMHERDKIATSLSYLRAPHRCESCLLGFQFEENLVDHVNRKHIAGDRLTIVCDVCQQYVDYSSHNIHMFWHYTRFECVACTEMFASYDQAAGHYRKNHHGGKSSCKFKCPYCPFKTGRKNWYTGHLRTKCESCGITPGCAMGTNVHMKNCTGANISTASRPKRAKKNHRHQLGRS